MGKAEKFAVGLFLFGLFWLIMWMTQTPDSYAVHDSDIQINGETCVVIDRKTETGWWNEGKRKWTEVYCGVEKNVTVP